jgi:hypothetical protein
MLKAFEGTANTGRRETVYGVPTFLFVGLEMFNIATKEKEIYPY